MKTRLLVRTTVVGLVLSLSIGQRAAAAEIKALSAVGMQVVIQDLVSKFEAASGHRLMLTFAAPGAIVQRVRDGEIADVVILPQAGIDGLLKVGKAAPGNVTAIARSSIGVAVRSGATRPDISSPEALRRTLLAAKSMTYSNPASGGASGVHFAKVLDRLGIAEEVKSKTIFSAKAGVVGELVARGEAEIAVHQFQELRPIAGIDIIGPLPGDLQDTITFSVAILDGAINAAAAKALADYLRSSEAASVIKAKGMESASP